MADRVESKAEAIARLRGSESELRRLGVRRIGLFGSFVRDEATPDSDVDVLVEFEPGRKTFHTFMKLSFYLEEIFRRRVEVVTTEALSPYIGPRILESVEYVAQYSRLPASYHQRDRIPAHRGGTPVP